MQTKKQKAAYKRKYDREYYRAHRREEATRHREYYLAHRSERLAYNREYNLAHRSEIAAYNLENRDRDYANARDSRARNRAILAVEKSQLENK